MSGLAQTRVMLWCGSKDWFFPGVTLQERFLSQPMVSPNPERLRAKLASSGNPYLTLKAAVSLDGRIATAGGHSQWITGSEARAFGHQLRASHDAVLVGRGTMIADDPQLTVRLEGNTATPARVVLDSLCRTSPRAQWLREDGARRILVVGSEAPVDGLAAMEAAGAEVVRCTTVRPQPGEFLPALRAMGLSSILVEGGGEIHASLIAQGEPDELFLIMAGLVIGGKDAPGWCASLGVNLLEEAPRLDLRAVFPLGKDIAIQGYF